jgi:serine protease Do
VGNPESGGISVTSGIISVDSEYVDISSPKGVGSIEMRVMRIDTPVNHGNSGGGLFDSNGRLIGIVNAKSDIEDVDDIGYAIPSNVVYAAAENIRNNYEKEGRSGVYKATIGMGIKMESSAAVFDEEKMQVLIREEIFVSELTEGSLAEGVFEVGDKLISMSSGNLTREVRRLFTPIDFILSLSAGDEITFTVERGGEVIELKIVLAEEAFSKVA